MCSTTVVLEQKRKQLEQEIADFRIQKENEYRTFEWQLLEDIRDVAHTASQRENGGPQTVTPSRKHSNQHETSLTNTTEEGGQHTGDISENRDDTNDISQIDARQPVLKDSNDLREREADSPSRRQFHEREQEFQGLFTPSYLPLLDSKAKLELKSNEAGKPDQGASDSTSSGHCEDACDSDGVQPDSTYSSSASFPNARLRSSLSPTPSRALSASVPRQPLHQRTSSSRSDTSLASLRSSLRDPNQPRSPKRVLFSIDNLVVSPSTSPLMKRTSTGSRACQSDVGRASRSVSDSVRADRRSDDSVWDVFSWTTAKSENEASYNSVLGKPVTASALTSLRSMANTSPSIGGDDFERIDADDELFAFDEDIGADEQACEKKEKPEDAFESDEEEGNGGAFSTSSPHAGSLPIEIKWPSRLGPNG